MNETVVALTSMHVRLHPLHDGLAPPPLDLKEYLLDYIVEVLRKAGARLEASQANLKAVEIRDG
jgi:hypothetical protein